MTYLRRAGTLLACVGHCLSPWHSSTCSSAELIEAWRKPVFCFQDFSLLPNGDVLLFAAGYPGSLERLARSDGQTVWATPVYGLQALCWDTDFSFYTLTATNLTSTNLADGYRVTVARRSAADGGPVWERGFPLNRQAAFSYHTMVKAGTNLVISVWSGESRGTTRLATSGELLWSIPDLGSVAAGDAAGNVFLATPDYLGEPGITYIRKCQSRDGGPAWSTRSAGRLAFMAVVGDGDLICAGYLEGPNENSHEKVVRLSGKTGELLWSQLRFSSAFRSYYRVSDLLAVDDFLYVADVGGSRAAETTIISKRDLSTGRELWSYSYSTFNRIGGAYVESGGDLLVLTHPVAIDAPTIRRFAGDTGQLLWERALTDSTLLRHRGSAYVLGSAPECVLDYLRDVAFPPRLALRSSPGATEIHVSDMEDSSVEIQVSEDLRAWSSLEVVPPGPENTALRRIPGDDAQAFFRAVRRVGPAVGHSRPEFEGEEFRDTHGVSPLYCVHAEPRTSGRRPESSEGAGSGNAGRAIQSAASSDRSSEQRTLQGAVVGGGASGTRRWIEP